MLQITEEVRVTYPTTTFGIMVMKGLNLQDPTSEFLLNKTELQTALRQRFAGMDKKEMRAQPPFSHYHNYYKKFKKTYHVLHQCESIATGSRNLPNGAPLVQAMFMAEIKNQLLTAGYDCSNLQPSFTVSLADGDSSFLGMGKRECSPPKNDIVFSANQTTLGSIICGPDHAHRIQAATADVLFAIYGVPGITTAQIRQHLEDIHHLVRLLDPKAEMHDMEIM